MLVLKGLLINFTCSTSVLQRMLFAHVINQQILLLKYAHTHVILLRHHVSATPATTASVS